MFGEWTQLFRFGQGSDDTLVLDQRTEWPMQMKVAGRKKLLARAKFDASRKSFSIISHANREESSGHSAR